MKRGTRAREKLQVTVLILFASFSYCVKTLSSPPALCGSFQFRAGYKLNPLSSILIFAPIASAILLPLWLILCF